MSALDSTARELRGLVNDFLNRFHRSSAADPDAPHAGLNAQELRVVERLGDVGPAKMGDLADCLRLAANSVTTLVDNLERQGVVRRQRSAEDRRVVRVELTDAGQRFYKSAVSEMLSLLRTMLGALNASERDAFMTLFRKIADAGANGGK